MADDTLALAQKAVPASAVDNTVQVPSLGQSAFSRDSGLIFFAATQGDELPAWGTNIKMRDAALRSFIPRESLFSSALGTVCARNAAFSWKIEGPEAKAKKYQRILAESNFGRGWADMVTQVSIDLYTQDSGAFIEVIRDGETERSNIVGLAHLDAGRCYHTGLPEAPVVYQNRRGEYRTLKWFQVIALREMPATYEGIPGVQYCALTRLFQAARILRDVSIYLQEKIGGRNARAITLVKGVTTKQINEAMTEAAVKNDSIGLMRFSQPIMVGSIDPKADIGFETLELASLPDGFDLDLSQKQYIGQMAMAFLTDYQEFAPLPGGGLGTSTQSQVLHAKSRGKGPGLFMKLIATAINFMVLPNDTEFDWDEQDLEADQADASVRGTRAATRAARIASGELTVEGARQIAHEDGDLDTELMEAMNQADLDDEIALDDERQAEAQDALDKRNAQQPVMVNEIPADDNAPPQAAPSGAPSPGAPKLTKAGPKGPVPPVKAAPGANRGTAPPKPPFTRTPKLKSNANHDPASGQFSHGDALAPHGGIGPKMASNTAAWAEENDVTQTRVRGNVRNLLDSATAAQTAEGMEWYQGAHDIAGANAVKYGTTGATQAHVLAVLSPQANWDMNVKSATLVNEFHASGTFTLTPEAVAAKRLSMAASRKQNIRDGKSPAASDRADRAFESIVSVYLGKTVDPATVPADHVGRLIQTNVPNGNVTKAIHLLRGANPDGPMPGAKGKDSKLVGGIKVRSFSNNINDPSNSKSVTIDTHMINGVLNQKKKTGIEEEVFRSAGKYDTFKDAISAVAKERGIAPNQAQAIAWTAWRDENGKATKKEMGDD